MYSVRYGMFVISLLKQGFEYTMITFLNFRQLKIAKSEKLQTKFTNQNLTFLSESVESITIIFLNFGNLLFAQVTLKFD